MKEQLFEHLRSVAAGLDIEPSAVNLEYSDSLDKGDLSTSVALASAKKLKEDPRALADKIITGLKKAAPDFVATVESAGPGFINFRLKDEVFTKAVVDLAKHGAQKQSKSGKKVMVEYTDPNPFKVFHIGHLMSNAIGESLSRLIEHSGAQVIRACYQGDVGLHVAKTIWAIMKNKEKGEGSKEHGGKTVTEKVKWLGEMYIEGSKSDDDQAVQKEIIEINKKIFSKSDPEINKIYEAGRKWSLEYFDLVYKRLGTKFDKLFFESEVSETGVKAVNEFLGKKVFEKSEGAIVWKGEEHGLHTRVFITSQGLPTYEAKELGLNEEKFKLYPDLGESIIITANEQSDYFKVLLKVLSLIRLEIAQKTKHISHGIMRLASGKMSSRKGNIVSAESLIDEIRMMVKEKMVDREFAPDEAEEIADEVAIAAIKYTILRQGIGGDVVFDSAASISFEGDSGPYLQYSAVRAQSVLAKAEKTENRSGLKLPDKAGQLERLIIRFPDIASRARQEYAPQQIAGYLIELAGAFNAFYAGDTIVDPKEPLSLYRIALTRAFLATMTDGLSLLGIKVPKKM